MMTHVALASISIPFPGRISPDAGQARCHTIEWLRGFGLLDGDTAIAEYDTLQLERLTAFFYPDAVGTDLDLGTDANGWVFVFDDQFDGPSGQRPETVARLVDTITRIMDETKPPLGTAPAALADSFRDLWLRATDGRPALWRHRFREHWADYLRAYHWEAVNRTAGDPPGLFAFLRARRDSIGVQTCLDLVERCGGYTLPDEVHAAFPLAAMRQLTEEVVIFVNDIVSLDKELAAGDVNNSVLVLRHEQDCTLPQAAHRVAAMANTRVERFQQLATRLAAASFPPVMRANLDHYVDGMRNIMRGNLDWSLETSRYGDAGIAAVSGGRQRPWANLIVLPAQGS
jgi:hypothetical protein